MKPIQTFNRPAPIDLGEYDRAIDAYVDRVAAVEKVRSVFTMGSIKAPGLSDIDMIVVVDDDFDPARSARLSTAGIDDRLFIHGPVVLPTSMIPALQYIIYASGLERRTGNDALPEFDQLDVSAGHTLRLAYTIDFLASRQVQYDQVLDRGRLNQRAWMARLWSLTHSETLLSGAGAEISEADTRLLRRIRALRSAWIDKGTVDDEDFVDVFLGSIETSRALWLSALQAGYARTGSRSPVMRFRADNRLFEFREEIEYCQAGAWTLHLPGRQVKFLTLTANPLYAAHLAAYGYIDQALVPVKGALDFDCLARRAQQVRAHQQWLSVHCPDTGSMSGYTGVNVTVAGMTRRAATTVVGLLKRYKAMRT